MNNQKVLNALLRSDLNAFTRKVFDTVSAGATFSDNWHLHAIAHYLNLCAEGKVKRLIITLPPRSLKSISASVALPAWILGRDPTQKIICVSYAHDLAIKHSLDTRAIMTSDWYQQCFKQTRINQTKNTQSEFITSQLGFRLATSVGGSLTGLGGDMIIIDDPHKSDEAESETKREGVIEWYRNTLISRLDSKLNGVIIVIQQRLHESDLAGYLLETGEWTHLNLPAIAEENESILVGPDKYYHRKENEVLHPDKEPIEVLNKLKTEMGSYIFAAQYQQRPAPLGGGMIKWAWFNTYDKDNLYSSASDQIIQSWDTASKVGEMNDWSVCTTWLFSNNRYYLLDLYRKRLEFPGLSKAVKIKAQKWAADLILIEAMNAGIPLIQDLRVHTQLNIYSVIPKGDKATRMMSESSAVEAGKVYLPKEADWLAEFQREVVQFPKGKHDDQVDSLSQFLKWARGRQPAMQQLTSIITPIYADPVDLPF